MVRATKASVYHDLKAFREEGTTQRQFEKHRSGGAIRTARFVAGLKRPIEENPMTLMTMLADSHGVNIAMTPRTISINLGIKSTDEELGQEADPDDHAREMPKNFWAF